MNPETPLSRPMRVSSGWRAATYALLVLLAVAVTTTLSMFEQFKAQIGHLQTQLKSTSQIRYVAVLLDDKAAPALLVTLDPQEGVLQLQRLNAVKEGREDTMQLWALRPEGPARSLGILQSKAATLRMPLPAGALDGVQQLAISVEDKGGVGAGRSPRLPYLFQGALVLKAL